MQTTNDRPGLDEGGHTFASPTLTAHLLRGLFGFGPLVVAWLTWPAIGWLALLPAALGVVALRGCPMCWTVGLVQTVARGRYARSCGDGSCALVRTGAPEVGGGTLTR